MSYVNRHSGTSRNVSVMAVVALHAGAVWALINGLGIEYIKHEVLNLPTKSYPADPPPPVPEPPRVEPSPAVTEIIPSRPLVQVPDTPVFTLPPINPPETPDLVIPELPRPAPSLDPGPRFEPVGARPRGRPGQWVSPNDYPSRDLREGNAGTARFRLSIGTSGQVTGCEITHGTGHPGLDAATCAKLIQRARFSPARDHSGEPVAGTYSGQITWVIPD